VPNLELVVVGIIITFLVNIPFGYWRAYASKYKRRVEWIAAVHAPVPLIVLMRFMAGVGFDLNGAVYIALFVVAYFTGQRVGGLLYRSAVDRAGVDTRCFYTGLRYLFTKTSER